MRISLFLLILLTMGFSACGDSETEKKEREEQQEFQQRPDYSKDTLSACKSTPTIIFVKG